MAFRLVGSNIRSNRERRKRPGVKCRCALEGFYSSVSIESKNQPCACSKADPGQEDLPGSMRSGGRGPQRELSSRTPAKPGLTQGWPAKQAAQRRLDPRLQLKLKIPLVPNSDGVAPRLSLTSGELGLGFSRRDAPVGRSGDQSNVPGTERQAPCKTRLRTDGNRVRSRQ